MSDSSNSPSMGQPVADPGLAADTATKQATSNDQSSNGDLPQEVLEKMSGQELKEYFEAKKAKEAAGKGQGQPRQDNGKFAPKQDSKTPSPIKEAAKAAEEAVKKYKVKVDGAEIEVDEKELLRGYSHQRAASKTFQEGQNARKQAEQFIQMMRDESSLMETIKKLGHDPRQLAEKYLAQQLQEEMMDPREKELRDAKAKLKAFEDMERQKKEQIQKQYHEQMKAKYANEYQQQFIEALGASGLPPTKPMVAEMAKYIGRAAKLGVEMTAAEAAQLVKEDVQLAHRRLIGDTDGELLLKLLGEDVANKIRKYDVAKLKTPEQFAQKLTHQDQGEVNRDRSANQSGKRMSAKEWREFNRKGRK